MLEDREPPSIVKGIMNRPVITIDKDQTAQEAAKIMSENNIGCIIVIDEEKAVGIATERDILRKVVAKNLDASEVRMEDIMSKPLATISADTTIVEAIRMMKKNDVRHLPITQKEELVGLVTQRDLLRALALHVLISFRPLK